MTTSVGTLMAFRQRASGMQVESSGESGKRKRKRKRRESTMADASNSKCPVIKQNTCVIGFLVFHLHYTPHSHFHFHICKPHLPVVVLSMDGGLVFSPCSGFDAAFVHWWFARWHLFLHAACTLLTLYSLFSWFLRECGRRDSTLVVLQSKCGKLPWSLGNSLGLQIVGGVK